MGINNALAKLFFEANSALNQSHIVEENTSVLRKSYLRRFHVKSDSCKRIKIKDLMNFLYGKPLKESESEIIVVNCYTQYKYGYDKDVTYLDYEALIMCFKSIDFFLSN